MALRLPDSGVVLRRAPRRGHGIGASPSPPPRAAASASTKKRVRGHQLASAWAVGAVLGLTLALVVGVSPLVASNFGGPKDPPPYGCNDDKELSQCVAEDWYHQVHYDSALNSAYRDAIADTAGAYDTVGGIVVSLGAALGNANDVRVADGNYGDNNWYAWTRCKVTPIDTGDNGTSRDGSDMKWCTPQFIIFNNYYSHGSNNLRAIACHEFGHTLGLRHKGQSSGTSSCMRSTPTTDPAQTPPGPLTTPNNHDLEYHLEYEYDF